MYMYHNGATVSAQDAEDVIDPTLKINDIPKKELSALQSPNGGLELAQKIMGQWLLSMILIYYYATKATWTWYTEQRKAVLGACAAISFYIRCSRGCWQHEIQEMLKDALYTPKHLHEMGFMSTASSSLEHHQLLACKPLDFVT